jgi:hypothetical protein
LGREEDKVVPLNRLVQALLNKTLQEPLTLMVAMSDIHLLKHRMTLTLKTPMPMMSTRTGTLKMLMPKQMSRESPKILAMNLRDLTIQESTNS